MNYNLYTLAQLDRISRDGDLDEFTKAVLEKALDIEAELDAIKDVLSSWDYDTDFTILDEELHDVRNQLASYADESKELDRLREELSK